MRIREKPLDTWVIMRPDGSVDSAHCTCMAGLDECCSHVAAVLFTLERQQKLEVRLLLQMPLPIGCVPLVLDWMCLIKDLKI